MAAVLVSDRIETSLEDLGIGTVRRYAGADRFETARLIYLDNIGAWGTTAIIASGAGFPDACGAAPLAYKMKAPIFLAGADGTLSEETMDLIANGGFSTIVIAGGIGVVSPNIDTMFYGIDIVRIGGNTRYETSSLLATYGRQIAGLTGDSVAIVKWFEFPRCIGPAGPLQGVEDGGLILCDNGNTSFAKSWFSDSNNRGYRHHSLLWGDGRHSP